ncbi:hypothetical protein [Sphingobium sp. LB126]|uniref:hypothetical protein n=1 Tax=Sphingobium sp. LB126 TaxID=1983755 RepID=UPI0012FD4CD7|nr:hypothetical protein [Sphingobium sp. LB126]
MKRFQHVRWVEPLRRKGLPSRSWKLLRASSQFSVKGMRSVVRMCWHRRSHHYHGPVDGRTLVDAITKAKEETVDLQVARLAGYRIADGFDAVGN